MVAARNEFESLQVTVAGPRAHLRVSAAGPLVGAGGAAIPADASAVARVDYDDVKTPSGLEGAPGRWPDPPVPAVDPLLHEPRHAFPVDVPAGENRVAWVDVLVPVDTPPGVYRGGIDVSADDLAIRVPVEVTVLAFTLPSTARLAGGPAPGG
jgi:hypothetical protein